jgi:hypothetical protein
MIESIELRQQVRNLQVHPYAQLRAAQARVELAALAKTYASRIADLDIELSAIRPELMDCASRWHEASRYARDISVGTDAEPVTRTVKFFTYTFLLMFELCMGSLAMQALTAF